jgi:hypothetical protein
VKPHHGNHAIPDKGTHALDERTRALDEGTRALDRMVLAPWLNGVLAPWLDRINVRNRGSIKPGHDLKNVVSDLGVSLLEVVLGPEAARSRALPA